MKKVLLLFAFLTFVSMQVFAQRTVTGTVTSAEDGMALPGVSVVVKGTSKGTITDVNGKYSLEVPAQSNTLVFQFMGMETMEIEITGDVIDAAMKSSDISIDDVVVTALGVTREKKALGYAVQEVNGDEVSTAKDASFISSLSGKVSGVHIKKAGQIGGSVNIVMRGASSVSYSNQALFVVDGIPISNSNTSGNQGNGGGYDYGNAASDIDPESIESISVLKGATAAALYGSEAANGVVLITTKKGAARKGIGVTISQGVAMTQYDKNTFPEYQKEYGAGYGPYYSGGDYPGLSEINFNGTDVYAVPFGEDASFGEAFDPGLMVLQWDGIYPQLDTYGQLSPWVATENDPNSFFQKGFAYTTNVALEGGNKDGTFRLAYTNDDRTGILENSKIKKDILDFSGSYKFTDKLSVNAKLTYSRISGQGRYGTGYDAGNVMQSLKQWFQTNVDIQEQKDAFFATGENITWNANSATDTDPHYFDNPYWVIYKNYETDLRNRMFGKFEASYDVTNSISLIARFGVDSYNDLREERIAVGSLDQSRYRKYERTFEQFNYDLIAKFDKSFNDFFNLKALLGYSIKETNVSVTDAATTGGLVVPDFYSLSNSRSALSPPAESDINIMKYGYYGQVSLGLWNMWYIEGSVRLDQSSSLPEDDNTYVYPSASTSFVFNELLDMPWLSLGKIRVGYATVGNDAPAYSTRNAFGANTSFGTTPMYFIPDASNNPDLKNETTKEFEVGAELNFLQNRVGVDISYYDKKTVDLITSIQVPTATGFNSKTVNVGEMSNKGIELGLYGTPVKSNGLEWNISVNWTQNKNEVVDLGDAENLLIYSNWSTAINARVGEPYGTITGTNYVYLDGQKVVGADGKYQRTTSTEEIIGNIQPDWNAGISNRITYKGISLSFLIDMQKGGDIVSYDMAFGQATGLYATTAGLNELGNPKRDRVADGGGVLLAGVTADGQPNTTRAEAYNYLTPYGYYGGSSETGTYAPDAQLVYDASYVKLREVTLEYALPRALINKIGIFTDISVALYGRNLWIIDKNLPYGDPEYQAGSGNRQGIQNATLPSSKEYGFNIRIKL